MVPGSGLVPSERRFEFLLAGLLGATVVGTTAFVGSLVVATMTAVGALGPGASLWVLLALLLVVLLAGVGVAGAGTWLAWLALAQLRAGVAAGWRKLLYGGYRRARTFEERSALGRLLRPSRVFESAGDRDGALVTELKSRYVAGELDELAFENELARLLGGADVGRRVRREIEVTAADGGDEDDRASGDEGARETEPERERG